MVVYILNPAFEVVGVIDEAESVLWNKRYNGAGDCEIYIPCNDTMLQMLRRGNYVYRYDDDMLCKIVTVEIETDEEEGNSIIATGVDVFNILSGRIVRWKTTYSGTVANYIKKLLIENVISPAQANRAIPNFIIDDSNFTELTDTIETSNHTQDLTQLIMAACKTCNYGFRLSLNIETKQLVFRLYKGKNRATTAADIYVEFSPEYSNILSSNYVEDESDYKNVVYVGYKSSDKDDETVYLLSLFAGSVEPKGVERREFYVDGTGTSRELTKEELEQLFPTAKRYPSTQGTETSGYYYVTEADAKALYPNMPVSLTDGVQRLATFEITTTDGVKAEKLTVTDYVYLILIRILGYSALAEHTRTQTFTGNVDTLDTYVYKADYDLGDIVKVRNEYGIQAEARIVEIAESEDNEDGYIVEPIFEFQN